MIRAGSALEIVSEDAGRAAAAAVAAAIADARAPAGEAPAVVLVFASGEDEEQARSIVAAARAAAGGAPVVGCGGGGVLASVGEVEGSAAVSALAIFANGELDVRVLLERGLEDAPEAAGQRLGRAARETFSGAPAGDRALYLMPDAFVLRAPPLLAGIAAGLGADAARVTCAGAAAAGIVAPAANQWAAGARGSGDAVSSNAVAALALGGAVEIHTVVAQGCRAISPWRTVTRVRGNVVMELDGEPAFGVFASLVREPLAADLSRAARSVMVAYPACDQGDDFLVRGIAGFEPDKGWLGFGQPVREGQRVRFVLREADAARRALTAALGTLADRLAGRRPAFGLYFDCAGRGAELFGIEGHDVAYISRMLGDLPLAGFFGGGELGPRAPRDPAPALHLFSGVLSVVVPREAA